MTNFVDTTIDFPNSKIYIEQLFQRLQKLEVLTKEQVAKYKEHIGNVEKQENELDCEWT